MALAPDQWTQIAAGDSTSIPNVSLPPGRDYRIEIDLPVAVPDLLAGPLASAIAASVGAFASVRGVTVVGATVAIEMAG